MRSNVSALAAGLLFGFGLMLSGMSNPGEVLSFLDWSGVWSPDLIALGLNFVLMPLLGWGLGLLLFAEQPASRLALLLTALLPTSGMTISWTGLAKGNVPAAVKMTVIGLLAGSLLTPLYLQALLGTVVAIPLAHVAQQIALIVFLPMALGYLTQRALVARYGQGRFDAHYKLQFPPWSTLGVLGIVFVSMALKAHDILRTP
jgi:predicted Na+-dependent transporter